MKTIRTFGLIGALLCASAQAADKRPDAGARLDEFLRGLTGLAADFEQVVKDAQGRVVEKASGRLALQRPDRFRWDYLQPHAQVIVADGEKLWFYDPDLEQVTVRPLEHTLAGTPAAALAGGDVRMSFNVEGVETRGGLSWVNLTPKRNDTDFKRMRLGLRGNLLVIMELVDKLGQVTRLEFSRVERNPTFAPDRFVFVPPMGSDVIGDAGSANSF